MILAQLIDEETNSSIIICHSSDPNVFKYIKEAAPYLKIAKEQHRVDTIPNKPNNYWDKVQTESRKYNLDPMIYLEGNKGAINLPERAKEHWNIFDDGSCNGLMKKAIKEFLNRRKAKKFLKENSFKDMQEKYAGVLHNEPELAR